MVPNLYLTEQGSILRKKGDRLIVDKEKQVLLEVECHKIDAVLIFGNVQFTTQAVHELFQHGIELAILTKTGKLIGQITSPTTKNIELRMEQFRKYGDDTFRLRFARNVVKGKIRNCLQTLRYFSYNHPEIDLNMETEALESAEASVLQQTTIGGLCGLEGMAARHYFNGLGKMILGEFRFVGRKKYPAPDPVNALLSLGYTLIFNEISSLLDGMGFDPYLGYYHKLEYGRPSLASDLLEEFRAPVADRLALRVVNNRILKPEDFYNKSKGEGVHLKREAMKKYFAEYEDFVMKEFIHSETKEKTCFRKCFRIQIEKLASCIRDDKEYQPFYLEI